MLGFDPWSCTGTRTYNRLTLLVFFEYHSRTSNSSSGLFDGGEEGLPYGRDKLKISWVIYA
jgi:hypothetical protein